MVNVVLASEAEALASLEALPPPDALPVPEVEVTGMWSGLSSLVEQLRPPRTTPQLVDLPEELLLNIVERAFLASIAAARPVERLASLAQVCRALRFLGSERCAEHLARALYPASSLRVATAARAEPMWRGLSSLVKELRQAKGKGTPTAAAAAASASAAAAARSTRHAYSSWRKCLTHDNASGGVWCVEVDGLALRVPPSGPPTSSSPLSDAQSGEGYCEARIQAVALDLHDDVAEVVVLIDAVGDAYQLSKRMLHETRFDHRRHGWSSPVYRLLGPGRQVMELSFPFPLVYPHDLTQPFSLDSSATGVRAVLSRRRAA